MEKIPLKEQNSSKENTNNINSKKKKNNQISSNNNTLNNKSKKRKRDYSPSMDIEEEQISNSKSNSINKRNKRMKVPLRKLVERIHLDEKKEQKDIKVIKSKET